MALIRKPVTEKSRAANRRNARKSTGPTTPEGQLQAALNAYKAGVYARSSHAAMVRLGEDPTELEKTRQELEAAYQPQTAAERLQIDRIAWLHWEERRNHRARLWKLARRQEEMVIERERQWLEAENQTCRTSHAELMEKGLMARDPSPSKFAMLTKYLGILVEAAEDYDFSIPYEDLLRLIYGRHPTLRGNGLLNQFRLCAGEAAKSLGKPAREQQSTNYRALMKTLCEEERDVLTGHNYYLQNVVNISTARRQATLATSADDWALLHEQKVLGYQLESAYRVLFGMQRERERAPKLPDAAKTSAGKPAPPTPSSPTDEAESCREAPEEVGTMTVREEPSLAAEAGPGRKDPPIGVGEPSS